MVSLPALMTLALPLTGAARYSTPFCFSIARSSAEPSSEIDEHSITMRGFAWPPRSLPITSLTSSQVETMQKTMSRRASSASESTIFAPYFASGSALARVRFQTAMSHPPFARRAAISKPMRPVPIQPSFSSVGVGNRKFLCGIKRNDARTFGRKDHLFLDARGRDAVGRRAIGLHREHHAGLELDRLAQRRQARDERTLVQAETEAVAEIETEGVHLAREADLLCLRHGERDLVGRPAGLQQLYRAVHPFARLAVGGALRGRGAADVERAVVARAVAHERLDDVEERLVSRADQPIGEVVRMRRTALAGDRVDRLDAVGTHLVETLGGKRHDLRLLHAGLQRLGDVLVHPLDHGASHVEQRELVDVLHFARFEHHLLTVAHFDTGLLQLEQHRRLDHIDAERHVGHALLLQDAPDFLRRAAKERDIASRRSAQAEQSGPAVVLMQPRRMQLVVARRAAEVPDVGIARAGEERIARELVPRPLANHGAGGVADVVLIEAKQRPEARMRERGAHAPEAIVVQPAEIDAFLEIDLRTARRLQRPIPAMVRIDVVRTNLLGLRRPRLLRHWLS